MKMPVLTLLAAGFAALSSPWPAWAVTDCELDGRPINTNNGAETAGKSGLLRCKDRDSGVLQREQELRDGQYVGALRYYRQGVLEQERHTNARGNGEGVQRTYAATPGSENPLLREEIQVDGRTVGLARSWHRNGQLQRATFYGERQSEEAMAEFTSRGRLSELRCATQPRLAPAVDDAALCGHQGRPANVELFAESGVLRARLTIEAGRRVRSQTLWDSGQTRELEQLAGEGGTVQSFNVQGVMKREQQWVWANPAERRRRLTVLDREFADSGSPQRERRWQPLADGQGARLLSDAAWYLNGQPRSRSDYSAGDGGITLRRDQSFFDNGQRQSDGRWRLGSRGEQAIGVHQYFDDQGRLRSEVHHDERGERTREREFDEAGRTVRDDEVYADGSRKSLAR